RARIVGPSGRLYRILRLKVGSRRHHQSARLRMGRDWHHRECAGTDRIPFAPYRLDVRGHRARADRAQGLSRTRAEGPLGRTGGFGRPAVVPGVKGIGFLHRPHPVRGRWLHGGLIHLSRETGVTREGIMTDLKTISRRTLVKTGLGAVAAPAML